MESKSTGRLKLRKQSSLAADRGGDDSVEVEIPPDIDANIRLMYLANEGDLDGMRELFDTGVDANFKDIDDRTALHVAACQGSPEVVELLLDRGAKVDVEDRWGSTPLADAIHYKNNEIIKLLEKHGAKLQVAPMHVKNLREIPEYEIGPSELDFTNGVQITKGTFHMATWRGVQVAVKRLDGDVTTDEDKVKAFRDELSLLQKIRHPNVVQFLGAVTQSSPMMIVTEYLPKGDLRAFLKRKGALKPLLAVTFGLDIARGMNYLHEHKPEAIIHRDLEPSNILRDDSGHLKVADFGLSKLLNMTKSIREDIPLVCEDNGCRYVAPEVFRNEEYDVKVDVFSFALILQEMIEGCMPFNTKPDSGVPKLYAAKVRPPFRAPPRHYPYGLKELIVQCWSENPADRPTCKDIIERLTYIQNHIIQKQRWKATTLSLNTRVGQPTRQQAYYPGYPPKPTTMPSQDTLLQELKENYRQVEHTSTKISPFEVVYDQPPPRLMIYEAGSTKVQTVDDGLRRRDFINKPIQENLQEAQNRMKVRALRCFQNIEAIWKDRSNNPSSRSTRSTSSNF